MQIRRAEIENFRGIETFSWDPRPGLNLIIGAGDSGKSTILDALALAISPQPSQAATETDYRNMDTSKPFRIRILMGGLSEEFRARIYPPPLWGWNAKAGQLNNAPNEDAGDEAAVLVEVEGTPDLELQYRILQPGNDPRPLSVPARIAIGLWNVSTNRAPEAQLRMSRGSILERSLGRDRLRAPAVAAMQGTADTLRVPEEATEVLKRLASKLRGAGIDIQELALRLVPLAGQSPVQLVTLVARSRETQVPLANFGRGSQQIAMVTFAAAEVGEAPIVVIDEIEAGLEPYRQRALLALVRDLTANGGQAFITSHSPAVVGRLASGEAWHLRLDRGHSIYRIEGELERLLKRDPEAMLCRLPIVCEGTTEVGVAAAMFKEAAKGDPSAFGIYLINAGGHREALSILAALSERQIAAIGVVDNEDFATGKRTQVSESAFLEVMVVPGGRCMECAVANALPREALDALVQLPGVDGPYLNVDGRLQAVSARLGKQSRLGIEELISEYGETEARNALGEAAASGWFKSVDSGEQLGRLIIERVPGNNPLVATFRGLVDKAFDHLTDK